MTQLTTTINENADAVDLDVTNSVTLTVQLQDEDSKDVHKEDQDIQIEVRSYSTAERADSTGNLEAVNLHTLKTDAEGRVTYTVDAPKDATSGDGNDARYDTITITSGGLSVDTNPDEDDAQPLTIDWLETDPALTKALGSVALNYSLISGAGDSATARVPVTVTLYDQYGNRHKAAGQRVVGDH